MATKTSAKSNSVQSKCATRRRSICTCCSFDAGLLLLWWPGLKLHVFLDHFFCQRSGGIAAMAAVLDQSRQSNSWVLHRCVGDKPGMVAVKVGQLFALHVGTPLHLHNLRRPCLAGDFDDARPRCSTGTPRAFNDVRQGLVQTFQSRWL